MVDALPAAVRDSGLAIFAHELRQPLDAARWGLRIIHETGEPAARDHACQVVERQVDRMQRLVEDLLDLHRIGRDQLDLQTEQLEVGNLVEQAGDGVRSDVEARGVRLSISLLNDALFVNGDPVRLEQVVSNLVSNAAKHTDRGGEIRISVTRQVDEVVVRVSDTGSGIDPELLPHVFEPFVRQRDEVGAGLGIGLTIVQAIVERHNGRVEAYSAGLGQGSEFVVRLPLSAGTRR
jgi:signal transduction histidine kinase